MLRSTKKLSAVIALAGATVLMTFPFSAEARCANDSCGARVNTSYSYRTVQQPRNVTRYRDVTRVRPVSQVTRVVNVTRVQPVTRVNTVTRVHNRTAVINSNQYASRTERLGARNIMTGQTVHIRHASARPSTRTVYRYNTVQRVNNVTRYNDVNRTRYVRNINRHVTITRVQPVIRTNVVTRVHDRTVVVPRTVYASQTQVLPARMVHTGKTVTINHGAVASRANYSGRANKYRATYYGAN